MKFSSAQPVSYEEKIDIIKTNWLRVKDRIERVGGGRHIRVVAITKYVDESWCQALIECGLTELGENRVLEGIQKYKSLRERNLKFTAHMVGGIQSNKAGKIPGNFDFVQSVDREKIADILSKKSEELGLNLPVLIEVNIDEEPQKSGCMPAELMSLAERIVSLPALSLQGLMCMPRAPSADGITAEYERQTRNSFARCRKLFEELRAKFNKAIGILSMGMSLDFEWAIAEGANMLRLGRILYLREGEPLNAQPPAL